MRWIWGLTCGGMVILSNGLIGFNFQPAIAAEYQGKNIDGKKFPAQAYLRETGGLFDVQVEFKQDQAILYFGQGSRQKIRLTQPVITDPSRIEGWGMPFSVQVGGKVQLGILEGDLESNPQQPRSLEGLWQIRIKAADLR